MPQLLRDPGQVRQEHEEDDGEREERAAAQEAGAPLGRGEGGGGEGGGEDRPVVAAEDAEADDGAEERVGGQRRAVAEAEEGQDGEGGERHREGGVGEVEEQVPVEVQRRQHGEAGAGGERGVGLQAAGDGVEAGEGGEDAGEAERVDDRQAGAGGVGGGPGQPVEGGRVLRLVAPGEGLGEQERLDVVAAAGGGEEGRLERHEREVEREAARTRAGVGGSGTGARWLPAWPSRSGGAVAEERRADADVGGAVGDGGLEVAAHAHGEAGEAVARRRGRQEPEVGDGVGVGGRDRHEAEDGEVVGRAAGGEERGEGVGVDAGLLRLAAGVDLEEEGGAGAAGLHRLAELAGEAVAVEAVDGVEELEGAGELVRLQRADEVELGAGEAGAERGPLAFGFLDAVLAEDPLAGGEHGLDAVERLQLGDGDEGDRVGRAAGARRGRRRCGSGCRRAACAVSAAACAEAGGSASAARSELHGDAEVADPGGIAISAVVGRGWGRFAGRRR